MELFSAFFPWIFLPIGIIILIMLRTASLFSRDTKDGGSYLCWRTNPFGFWLMRVLPNFSHPKWFCEASFSYLRLLLHGWFCSAIPSNSFGYCCSCSFPQSLRITSFTCAKALPLRSFSWPSVASAAVPSLSFSSPSSPM